MLHAVEKYVSDQSNRYIEELKAFLSIASISADSNYVSEMRTAAEFLRAQFDSAGLQAEIVETDGHPIVAASWTGAESAPTALVYGHYDVQPPDPLDQWVSPPFDPQVRGEHIFARGATDDKGQLFTHVKSVEAWLKTHGRLPVNVKFVVEGEEEVGSSNLDQYLEANREAVRCDVAVISDTSQYAPGIPAITYGLRGILACEVTLRGPQSDLHSGVFGGAVANPVNSLCSIVGKLHDDEGRVQIPGFYDDVIPLADQERSAFAKLPFDEKSFLNDLGLEAGWGEAGFSTNERRWARPTCDVNGIIGGYTGEGPKTIVPSSATAKITCRLVPHQDAAKLTRSLKDFFVANVPAGIRVEFTEYHGCGALVFDTQSPFMSSAHAAIERAFGVAPVMIREGGSIPVVATFRDVLGVDTLLLGWGQNTDNLHAPNERFSLIDFQRGTAASAALWHYLST